MGSSVSRSPFRSLDRVMAVAGCIADMLIGLELEFSGSLDAGRLAAEPGFRPAANPGTSRSLWQVMRRVPWHAYPRVYLDFLGETWRGYIYVPKAVQALSLRGECGGRPVFVCRSVPEDRVARLVEYGHAVGATINDMVLAGFFRALASQGDWDRKRHLRIMTSVDLRRYLPGGRGDAVANLSSPEGITLGAGLGDGFPGTLKMVAAHTQRRKSGWIGLGDCVGTVPAVRYLPFGLVMAALPKVVRATIRWHRFPPILTNMGVVDPEAVTFDRAPLRASFLPPPYHPPAFFAAVGSYAGILTLSAGIPSSEEGTVGRFFDRVLSELPA